MSLAATIPWSDYQKLPQDQRSRPLTDQEYRRLTPSQLQAGGLADREEGAPADFNGPVFPNPDHIRPQWDTEPSIPVTRLPVGVSFKGGVYRADAQPHEVGAKMSGQAMPWEEAAQQQKSAAMPWEEAKAAKAAGSSTKTETDQGDRFAQDRAITEGWAQGHPILGPIARFTVTAGQNAADAITKAPGQVYHAIADPTTLDEAGLSPEQRFTYRMGGKQALEAGQDYAAGHVSSKGAASVLPEALGTGVGQVAGGAAYGKLVPEAFDAAAPSLNRIARTGVEVGKGAAKIGDVATFERAGKIANTVGKTAQNVRDIWAPEPNEKLPSAPGYERFEPNTGAPAAELPAPAGKGVPYGEATPAVKRIARPEPDLTGQNKPFAGGLDEPKPGKALDATGENRAFAGGMDEYIPKPSEPAAPGSAGSMARSVEEPPAKVPTPSETSRATDPLLEKLRQHAQAIREENAAAQVPGPEEDLTELGARSVERAKTMRRLGQPTEEAPLPETEDDFKARLARKADEMRARGEQPRSVIARPEPEDAYPVKITYDEQGIPTSETDGRHRVIQAIERGDDRIPVIVDRGNGPVQTTVNPKILAREMGVTKESLAATDEQQAYRRGNLQPREPVTR